MPKRRPERVTGTACWQLILDKRRRSRSLHTKRLDADGSTAITPP